MIAANKPNSLCCLTNRTGVIYTKMMMLVLWNMHLLVTTSFLLLVLLEFCRSYYAVIFMRVKQKLRQIGEVLGYYCTMLLYSRLLRSRMCPIGLRIHA